MTPERFRLVEELYHAVRERTAGERAAVLARADPELRREVESLLLSPSTGGAFLDRPAVDNTPYLPDDPSIRLPPGVCLGPYRIECKLGEGGMGEVFRAIDTRLGRAVAIKTTHEQFSTRFEREARAISALNHPNICTLHDIGPDYLVMELVEGETLAARLKQGPLPIDLVRTWGLQIAAALVEAHSQGIVHRDLKPGNIMIGKSGIKVLDFGLAKSGADETITGSRMVMGTPAYMAPEQREGKPADARSDIYSLGCILYEMSTGTRLTSQRRRLSPRQLEKIVSRCLEEDPGRRWQSAAELEREFARIKSATRPWKIASAAAAIVVFFAAAYFYVHRGPKLTGKDTIVLADFRNMTGDPVFDETLRQGLAVQLEQSPFLSLASEQRIHKALLLMGQPAGAPLTPEVAREVCERTAGAAVLEGSIASLGSQYVLSLRAKSCHSGDIVDEEQLQAARKEDVLNTLTQIATRFRARAGESLAAIEKHSTPLAEATTPSLEALKAYSEGVKTLFTIDDAAALPFFKRAVEIDPEFAMAYAYLGRVYGDIDNPALSAESTTKAWQLRNRASDVEKFFVDASYDLQVTGNLERAQQTCEDWARTYPRELQAPRFLGLIYNVHGEYQKSLAQTIRSVELDPDFAPGYSFIATGYLFLDRLPEAENTLRRASERHLETPDFLTRRYDIAFLKGDQPAMERELALAKQKSRPSDWTANHEAFVLAYKGRLQSARTVLRRAVDLASPLSREKAALYAIPEALWEAFFGYTSEARQRALEAYRLSSDLYVEYGAAYALAETGDSTQSQTIAADLEKRFPQDTGVRFSYLPVIRARLALNRNNPAKAIELLQAAVPYELGNPRSAIHGNFGALYPIYVRGEAYLAAHRGMEASIEFQKILDHRGIVVSDPIGALAHLQLGRAFVLWGDKAKAKAAYEDFLTLWKDADPDIPILKRAESEYATLQ
jgi:tetratricopeptide (TPR) repeat protein